MVQMMPPEAAGPIDEADDKRCPGFQYQVGLSQHGLGIIQEKDRGDN